MPHIHEKIDWAVNGFIVHEQKVLMMLHKKLAMWLPPGGHIELDEDPITALYREIEEEVGLSRDVLTLQQPHGQVLSTKAEDVRTLVPPLFLDIHNITDTHKHIGLIYLLTSSTKNVRRAEAEADDLRWFSADDLSDTRLVIKEVIQAYALRALELAH